MEREIQEIERRIRRAAPAADSWSARIVSGAREELSVRRNVVEPLRAGSDLGVHLTVVLGDGVGYAATSDIGEAGIRTAFMEAREWAMRTRGKLLFETRRIPRHDHVGGYATPVLQGWGTVPLEEKLGWLREASEVLKCDDEIVDWQASLGYEHRDTLFLNSEGSRIEQRFDFIFPGLRAVASRGSLTQTRSGGGAGIGRQGGLEQLHALGFPNDAAEVAEQALQLLDAPECPEGRMDLLLLPGQMILQIHESIGHPLELDRILGDERNYAGTSFVTEEMFGSYTYGSPLLNVTHDPGEPNELASYGYDDEGSPAAREFLIENGILKRPLGSELSQARAGLPGVANARACSWNRPAIDRMANLNLEPGDASLASLIARVENGVMMDANRSWSIDDSRNKFQFGCEIGWRIENGKVAGLVRNPNYRGVSSHFWRHLAAVGDRSTYRVLGVPNCGKGEPNQAVYVGHASPACLFTGIEVFGGEAQ